MAGNLNRLSRLSRSTINLKFLIDYLKTEKSHPSPRDVRGANASAGVSPLMDTWISLQYILRNGERNRGIMIIKSRGMGHSIQVREFKLTDREVVIADADDRLKGGRK